jgi:hypothetical protein
MKTPRTISAHVARRLAVEADVDPRCIVKVLQGKPVRGSAGERAAAALRRAGLIE